MLIAPPEWAMFDILAIFDSFGLFLKNHIWSPCPITEFLLTFDDDERINFCVSVSNAAFTGPFRVLSTQEKCY